VDRRPGEDTFLRVVLVVGFLLMGLFVCFVELRLRGLCMLGRSMCCLMIPSVLWYVGFLITKHLADIGS
jgi:uncharacterized transporter YbjL